MEDDAPGCGTFTLSSAVRRASQNSAFRRLCVRREVAESRRVCREKERTDWRRIELSGASREREPEVALCEPRGTWVGGSRVVPGLHNW